MLMLDMLIHRLSLCCAVKRQCLQCGTWLGASAYTVYYVHCPVCNEHRNIGRVASIKLIFRKVGSVNGYN